MARVAAGGVRPRVRRPERWPSPTGIHYYHFDGLGSVIALTDSSGSVVNLYEYSVYGEVSASDPNHPNRFLFTGREFDKDTGLYYYRARYYNPYIGRFLQTDPAGDGMNPYAYCGNNAVGRIDPLGLRDFDALTDPDWYTFTFSFPASAIGIGITSDSDALAACQHFFDDDWSRWNPNWLVNNAHMHGNGHIHVRFIWQAYSISSDDPAPTNPALDWDWVMTPGVYPRFIQRVEETVIKLNGIGLLESWKLYRILAPSKARVEGWAVRPLGPFVGYQWWEAKNLVFCDTPFAVSSIGQWEFGKEVYHKSQINYFLEGYAMRHYNYRRWYAEYLVWNWKFVIGLPKGRLTWPSELPNEYFWFSFGWDDHGPVHWAGHIGWP